MAELKPVILQPLPHHPHFIDLTGQTFHRWTVLGFGGKHKRINCWVCRCSCGVIKTIRNTSLTHGISKSCGCWRSENTTRMKTKHGLCRTPEYRIWHHVLDRCNRPQDAAYHYYGGRGIKVCDRWHTFENFYADMGPRPQGLTLERIDNDGDYCPENCKWATWFEQANNTRRNTTYLTYNGVTKRIGIWALELGCKPDTLRRRLKRGWSMEKTLTQP